MPESGGGLSEDERRALKRRAARNRARLIGAAKTKSKVGSATLLVFPCRLIPT
jgi:hypothetical protein